MTRGIENNNPGNIKKVQGTRWQGQINGSDPSFVTFENATYGIRAIARVLITYQDKRRARDGSAIDTVQEIIDRWAPPSDNNPTDAYAEFVRKQLGLAVEQQLDVYNYDTMAGLVKAIIQFENGEQPYTDAQIMKGLVLAGIEPKQASLGESRTVKSSKVGIGATSIGVALTAVNDALPELKETTGWLNSFKPEWAVYAAGAIALVAFAAIVWARIDDKRKGLR